MGLKDEAILHIFDLPEHLCGKVAGKRFPPKKHMAFEIDEVEQPSCITSQKKERKFNTSPSKEDLISLVKLQQAKIKSLQQKGCRKQNKIKSLKDCIYKLSKDRLLSPAVADQLKETFSGLTLDLIVNHFNNQHKNERGIAMKQNKFALTLHFYSPQHLFTTPMIDIVLENIS